MAGLSCSPDKVHVTRTAAVSTSSVSITANHILLYSSVIIRNNIFNKHFSNGVNNDIGHEHHNADCGWLTSPEETQGFRDSSVPLTGPTNTTVVYSEVGTLFGHLVLGFLYNNFAVTSKESYLERVFSNFVSYAVMHFDCDVMHLFALLLMLAL